MTKAFYGPGGSLNSTYRLSPAPLINISTELFYANDSIIGYVYKLTLDGYCSNFRQLTDGEDLTNPDYYGKNIQKVLGNMELIRKLLSRNGSNLTIQTDDGSTIITAKGGTLRSLNFDESDNAWSTYSRYSAQIDFNEVEFLGSGISCASADFDASSANPLLTDMNSSKIKNFSDGWNFSINESSFDYTRNIDIGKDLQIHNMVINASYNISATGQNYYISDQLIPAHEQARLFAQKRLYDRVTQLVSGNKSKLFKVTTEADSACGSNTLSAIHEPGDGILGNITYLPYNENIKCEISESDGTFSANYSCILKSNAYGMKYSASNVLHTVNKSRTRTREANNKNNYSISVEGTIQGLVLGGLIYSAGNFNLPGTGSIFIKASDLINKYSSADAFYATIGSEQDLDENFKNVLGITYSNLNIINNCSTINLPLTPKPTSFNLTRNYIDGTINYNAEYTSNCIRDQESIQNIKITTENPVPILADFTVPNFGTIIQDIKTFTAKKININIEGKKNRECCFNIKDMILNIGCDTGVVMPNGISLPDPTKYILTQKQRTDNKTEGTYSISLSYICDPGCEI